jgi:hypothetical protein
MIDVGLGELLLLASVNIHFSLPTCHAAHIPFAIKLKIEALIAARHTKTFHI